MQCIRHKNLVERKNWLCSCCNFFLQSPGGHAIYRRNARVLKMQNFAAAYMKGGRKYGQPILSQPKFLGCIEYIDLARAKSEALVNIYSIFEQNIKSCNAKRLR